MLRNKKLITYLLLGFIFILAAFIRINNLSNYPVGFHIDEASLGYNGYSLLLTGKDENNNSLPLYIDMFGDNRPSGYHYLTILPIKFFGLTEFSTRLPAAFFGSITVFAMYFFTLYLFNSKKISLLSSLLLAISPWHVVLSRASGEAVVALFFIVSGFGLILYSLKSNKLSFLFLGAFLASFSLFFYHTPRVFVPMLFLSLLLFLFPIWRKYKNNLYKISLVGTFIAILCLSISLVFFIKGGTGRYSQVNIFGFPETKLVMAEQIRENGVAKTSTLVTRLFHNKLVNYSLTFTSNYLEYFSGKFLFMNGGLPIWYSVPRMGLIYLIELPFILLGLIFLATNKKTIYKIPLLWLLIAPVTASITVDDIPNINRVLVMMPMLEIVAAYGIFSFVNKIKNPLKIGSVFLIGIFLIYSLLYFTEQYYIHAPIHKNSFRNEGFSQMIKEVKNSYDMVDKIIVAKSGGMYPLVLFYMQYNPSVYQKEGSPKDADYKGFGKFIFVPQDCPSQQTSIALPKGQKTIYINKGECEDMRENSKTVYRMDGTKAFNIVYEGI